MHDTAASQASVVSVDAQPSFRIPNPAVVLRWATLYYAIAAAVARPVIGGLAAAVAVGLAWAPPIPGFGTARQGLEVSPVAAPESSHRVPRRLRQAVLATSWLEAVVFGAGGLVSWAVDELAAWPIAVAVAATCHITTVGLVARRIIDAFALPIAWASCVAALAVTVQDGHPLRGCAIAAATLALVTASYARHIGIRETSSKAEDGGLR